MIGKLLRLYPPPAQELQPEGIYGDLELPPSGRTGASPRPYAVINMVSSVDGKASAGGGSSGIGDQTDRRVMRTLRSKADAVMIGANTLRAEKLSLGLDEIAPGPQPLAVIATKTGDLPLESNLIVGECQEILIVTTQDAPKNLDRHLCGTARVLRAPATNSGDINLAELLEVLKGEYAIEVLLVEGGPNLSHALISQNLAHELFLTLAPKLLGGASNEPLTILNGPALVPIREVKLLSAHSADSELFLRYALLGHKLS